MGRFLTIFASALTVLAFALTPEGKPVTKHRVRRSDDTNDLQLTVEQLSSQVVTMQAQMTALQNRLDDVETPVGFSVTTSARDIRGLGQHQTVKFDAVHYNPGNGYDPHTGIFTAPLPGTYVLFLQTMTNVDTGTFIELDIQKNGQFVARTHAGYSRYENGSSQTLIHLNTGDRVYVNVGGGSAFLGDMFTHYSGFRISPN